MKRMKLKIESLHVDSFEVPSSESMPRGTVQAHVFNRDIPHDDSNALACATAAYCGGGETNGCVEYTGGVYIMTPLCPTP